MSSKPLVSVTIPSYNHGRFLPEAIESALSQTYGNIEIVIVDDASTDNSLEIARKYASKHSIIKVYTHPGNVNRGISRTADLAIQKASGVYWTPCCSDDVLYPEKVETELEYFMENPEVGLVCSSMDLIDAAGNIVSKQVGVNIADEPDQLETMLKSNPINAPTIMTSKEIINKIGLHEENLIYSDWDIWIRFAARYKIGFIPKSLIKYRIHSYNTSVVEDHLIHYERMRELYLLLKEKARGSDAGRLGEEKYRRIIDKQLQAIPSQEARVHLDNYYKAVADRNLTEAAESLKKAIKVSPQTALRPKRVASVLKHAVLGLAKSV